MRSKPNRSRSEAPSGEARVLIYGLHAVEAALANPRRTIRRLLLTANAHQRLAGAIARRGVAAHEVEPRDLDRELHRDAVHQGALLETEALPAVAVEDLAPGPASDNALLLVLDQVTDPHNVGAILRSAAAFGVRGLVMTERNSPPLAGALAKAASGGLEHVPVAVVTNLARALEAIADLGYFRIGLAGEAEAPLEAARLDGPMALVLGAEEKGMRRLTREACDITCRISTQGALASLNVSNAAAIALHTVRDRQR